MDGITERIAKREIQTTPERCEANVRAQIGLQSLKWMAWNPSSLRSTPDYAQIMDVGLLMNQTTPWTQRVVLQIQQGEVAMMPQCMPQAMWYHTSYCITARMYYSLGF